jgi:hypothetical protein
MRIMVTTCVLGSSKMRAFTRMYHLVKNASKIQINSKKKNLKNPKIALEKTKNKKQT